MTYKAYGKIFLDECRQAYPAVDWFEQRYGFCIDRQRLQNAARVLACPLKKNPPNWQHGRLIYAIGRDLLRANPDKQTWLDIGTAKGFSACVMSWAMEGREGVIHSVDVMQPNELTQRNSVLELDGFKTINEFVSPFIANVPVLFSGGGSEKWLRDHADVERINFAFIDGKHAYGNVKSDMTIIAKRQRPGDVILFDDTHIEPIAKAVSELHGYTVEHLRILPTRAYAIATKND